MRKVTGGIKLEIICAYLDNPLKSYTTREIIDMMNEKREKLNMPHFERSNITRAHSELEFTKVIKKINKDGNDGIYELDVDRAASLLKEQ